MIEHLLQTSRVIVCVGSGGVGKTTVSASLALAAALLGRKTLVMTIDPARRLANALGFDSFLEEEFAIPLPSDVLATHEAATSHLHAMMLDHKNTFDRLVDRYSPTAESAAALKANPWYQQMSTALAGVQDYMAVSKLYEMSTQRDYDLIILDTPPTSNALDFLEAPERMSGILNFQPLTWFQKKVSDGESSAGRLLRWGGASLLKALGRITGPAVIEDVTRLLQDLNGLYEGFRLHSDEAWKILRAPQTHFLLVSAPVRASLLEALFFHQKLLETKMPFRGLFLNRTPGFVFHEGAWHPLLSKAGICAPSELSSIASRLSSSPSDADHLLPLLTQLANHLQHQCREAELAREDLVFLKTQLGSQAFTGLLPAIPEEINDLRGLFRLSRLLLHDGLLF